MMDHAWNLQHRIEKQLKRLPIMKVETYFLFTTIVMFLMSGMLFIYCFMYRIDIWKVGFLSSPIQYLVLGMVLFVAFVMKKYKP